jgi:hypothetical protein
MVHTPELAPGTYNLRIGVWTIARTINFISNEGTQVLVVLGIFIRSKGFHHQEPAL